MYSRRIFILIGIWVFLSTYSFAATLKYVEYSSPLSLNPLNIRDDVSFRLSQLLFSQFLCVDKGMHTVSDLLDNTLLSQEQNQGNVYTFKLRQNVTWSDGTPFTAEDVKFTFDVIRHQNTATHLKMIRNIVKNVSAIDKNTIRFELYTPMGLISLQGDIGYIRIIPKHKFEANFIPSGSDFGKKWVCGSGPYKFVSWDEARDRIRLSWNNVWYRGWQPLSQGNKRIEQIEMSVNKDPESAVRSLVQGNIDLLPDVPVTHWQKISSPLRLEEYNLRTRCYVAFNCDPEKTKFFSDKRVRQALTIAVDRWEMLTTIYGKTNVSDKDVITGPYFPEEVSTDYVPLGYIKTNKGMSREQDCLQKARRLLSEAGFENGFTVELKAHISNEEYRRIIDGIVDALASIGVTVVRQEKEMSYDTWYDEVIIQKKFEMAFGEETFNEHTDVVETLFIEKAPQNISSYYNQQVEDLVRQKKSTYRADDIDRIKNDIQGIIRNDCPYLFLFRIPVKTGYTNKLHVKIHPYWFFGFINYWDKEE